jgi:cytochrome P450
LKNNHWLFGQFFTISKDESGAPMRRWLREVPNDGIIRYRHAFNRERVLLVSPKALAEVLVMKNYEFLKPVQFRHGLGRLLGIGVLLAEGDEHKKQRRMLMPAFSYRHIKSLYPIFWAKGREVTDKMTALVESQHANGNSTTEKPDSQEGAVVEISNWTSRVTLDIIGVAGIGHDFNAIQDPSSELNQCYRRVFQPDGGQRRWFAVLSLVVPHFVLTNLPFKRNYEVKEARALIRRVCHDLITEKKAKLAAGKSTDKDILSVALESGGFTDENLIDQLMTFLAAGHETTASAMVWACYLLCNHPAIQTKLRAEIRANLPPLSDALETVTADDVDKMSYLHAVCNEVLRFIPPVPMTMRVAGENSTILSHPIPKGTTIVIAPWAVNRNPELWGEDVDEFKPERWLTDDGHANNTGGADSNYSFLTFLHGPRSCIGQRFAQAEFACLIAAWVGRFEMELVDKDFVPDIAGGITAKPRGGLKVRLRVVEGW